MSNTSILLIALALAVDAFSVALAAGISLPEVGHRHTFRLSWHFGLFQGLMNILGWAAGLSIRNFIESYAHWVAFILLAIVGVRMIIEARRDKQDASKTDPTRGKMLVFLSIATSIDSLAVGISFSLLQISIWIPALVIGIVAALFTAVGLHLGNYAKSLTRIGSWAEVMCGFLLIFLGLKILYDHGVFQT
ncbi:MAG: manganese efflux pump MntP family protein [Proteobacteria bacterium]|nr:manganese efflux pump MntP family protein [Pseudomonadota bacterium]MBU1708571.1 manganese efflux pump MntP family protein [Pseudomonadota bacterium]